MPTPTPHSLPLTGGCPCHLIRYRLTTPPLIVNCCHCRWCQRETGASFALNGPIEHDRVILLPNCPDPLLITIPSESGAGQVVARCPKCYVALWSNYNHEDGPLVKCVRMGTLDHREGISPDVHIYTESKQEWVLLGEGVRALQGGYAGQECWSEESQERYRVLKARGGGEPAGKE